MNGQVSVRIKTDSTSPSDHPEIFTASGGINGITVRILENISGYNEKTKSEIDVKCHLKMSSKDNGYIRLFVDGQVVEEREVLNLNMPYYIISPFNMLYTYTNTMEGFVPNISIYIL